MPNPNCILPHKEAINNLKYNLTDKGYKNVPIGKFNNRDARETHVKEVNKSLEALEKVRQMWDKPLLKMGLISPGESIFLGEPTVPFEGDKDGRGNIMRRLLNLKINMDAINKVDEYRKSVGIYDTKEPTYSYLTRMQEEAEAKNNAARSEERIQMLKDKYTPVKEGVSELFESNLELANQVYEAVGITQEATQQPNNTVQDLSGNIYSVNESDIITYETEFGPIRYITDENGDMVMLSDKNTDAVEDQIESDSQETVKEGVSELFESNPELANSVYEALGFKQDSFKQTFKSSLWRGQEGQPYINENGDLVLTPTYDTLFKSEGISFAENLAMAQEYGERYSKNPFIIEIDEDYANTIYPLNRKGRSQDYGKRVVGDEMEQRFVSKNDIIIPKGKFKIHKQKLNLNLSDVKTNVLLEKYQEQFIEGDVSEYLRYGEISKGYATEDPLMFQEVERELLKRGITKEDLPFLIQNPLNGFEYNVAEALGITQEFTDNSTGKKINLPDETSVTQKDIEFYLNKVKEVESKLENKGTKSEISFKNTYQITPQQKQQALQVYSQYLDTIFPDSKVKDIVYRGAEKGIENHRAYSHWTLRKALADNFTKQGVNLNKKEESNNTVYFALLNVRNLIRTIEITDKSLKDKGFDSAASFPNSQKADGTYFSNEEANESIQLINKNLNNEITVFEPEQIHILGSKQDIEGFKEFVNDEQSQKIDLREQIQNTPNNEQHIDPSSSDNYINFDGSDIVNVKLNCK